MAILISTPQQLYDIRNNLAGQYELANDIDMSSWGQWTPIGDATTRFTGVFDGNGYKVLNLLDNLTNQDNRGLFGYVENSTIKNVGVVNANVKGRNCVSAISGRTFTSNISNCYSSGSVIATIYAGGISGLNSSSTISNCYSHATVSTTGTNTSTCTTVGGLLGNGDINSNITNCYSTGIMSNFTSTASGLIGAVSTATTFPTVTNSYWDVNTSGRSTSKGGGTPKTTTEMKTQSTFVNWDVTSTWLIDNNYPTLQVFTKVVGNKATITVDSYSLPFATDVSKINKTTKQLNSYTNAIQSDFERHIATIRNVESYHSTNSRSIRIKEYWFS